MKPPATIAADVWSHLEDEARRRARASEPAHDFFHVERVVKNARLIAQGERLDGESEAVVMIAALLHELFTLPKDHPESSRAGDVCADRAREVLAREGLAPSTIALVSSAIRDHAFSKGVVPDVITSRVLQDADRLDALGAIGLARMWATCADMKRPFYSPEDPFCATRLPEDKAWGLDHVFKKLLVIPSRLHTETARELAKERVALRVGADLRIEPDRTRLDGVVE